MPQTDDRVLDKLDRLEAAVSTLSVSVAKLAARDDEHAANIHRFWGKDWPALTASVADHRQRITALEALRVQELDARLAQLEQWRAKTLGALAVILLLWTVLSAVIIKWVAG